MKVLCLSGPDHFDRVVRENKYVVVDFFTDWCGPCKLMDVILRELAKKYRRVKFVKVDADNSVNEPVVKKFKINAVPTLIFLCNGKEVGRHVGLSSISRIEDWIRACKHVEC